MAHHRMWPAARRSATGRGLCLRMTVSAAPPRRWSPAPLLVQPQRALQPLHGAAVCQCGDPGALGVPSALGTRHTPKRCPTPPNCRPPARQRPGGGTSAPVGPGQAAAAEAVPSSAGPNKRHLRRRCTTSVPRETRDRHPITNPQSPPAAGQGPHIRSARLGAQVRSAVQNPQQIMYTGHATLCRSEVASEIMACFPSNPPPPRSPSAPPRHPLHPLAALHRWCTACDLTGRSRMTTRGMARQALSEHSLRQPLSLWLCRRPPLPFCRSTGAVFTTMHGESSRNDSGG